MSRGTATADYIMEDPREALRLEIKVDPDAWVQKYLAHRVCPGAEVLSVGCGPGVILRAVANLDSSIRATGIDISSERLQHGAFLRRHQFILDASGLLPTTQQDFTDFIVKLDAAAGQSALITMHHRNHRQQ